MPDMTTLPGAEIALRAIAAVSRLDSAGEYFTYRYSEAEWDWDNNVSKPVAPHFIALADCSDTFFWGSADAEEITDANIEILEATAAEVLVLSKARYAIERTPEFNEGYKAEMTAAYQAHVAECPMTQTDGTHANQKGCSSWKPGGENPKFPLYAYRFETSVSDLFASRSREMRPQGACYRRYPEEMWPLFNACGPEREVGMGNPRKPGE